MIQSFDILLGGRSHCIYMDYVLLALDIGPFDNFSKLLVSLSHLAGNRWVEIRWLRKKCLYLLDNLLFTWRFLQTGRFQKVSPIISYLFDALSCSSNMKVIIIIAYLTTCSIYIYMVLGNSHQQFRCTLNDFIRQWYPRHVNKSPEEILRLVYRPFQLIWYQTCRWHKLATAVYLTNLLHRCLAGFSWSPSVA